MDFEFNFHEFMFIFFQMDFTQCKMIKGIPVIAQFSQSKEIIAFHDDDDVVPSLNFDI